MDGRSSHDRYTSYRMSYQHACVCMRQEIVLLMWPILSMLGSGRKSSSSGKLQSDHDQNFVVDILKNLCQVGFWGMTGPDYCGLPIYSGPGYYGGP